MFRLFNKQKNNPDVIYDPFLQRPPLIQSMTGSYLLDTVTAIIVAVAFFGFFFGG